MLTIDGSRYSGSGTIVRLAVALGALTGQEVRITNVRTARREPGLRPQHVWVVEAIRELSSGYTRGNCATSRELTFSPRRVSVREAHTWDIGSAGSTVLLSLAVLPLLALRATHPVSVEVRGGLFQDFAPSYHHLRHVMLPFLEEMGVRAQAEMVRPGYVPQGQGVLRLHVEPLHRPLQPLTLAEGGRVESVWGIALSSHLDERNVSERMAQAATEALAETGYRARFDLHSDPRAVQRGAALAAFADTTGGARLGADRAGGPRRRAEDIGHYVARQLLDDLGTGAAVDRHAADQLIVFAALAEGESVITIPRITDHVQASAWLAEEFLGAGVEIRDRTVRITGVGLQPEEAARDESRLQHSSRGRGRLP
jgi:RNA 3'-terminal phosphate cyclase (ATP)